MSQAVKKYISAISLNNNQLKIIALIAMTCDHVGKQILFDIDFLPVIGRLAFPIFAYMIAEGCKYTKNMKKYFLTTASVALLCQVVYFIAMGSLYQCVLVTFSLSIMLIAIVKKAQESAVQGADTHKLRREAVLWWLMFALALVAVFIVCTIFPNVLTDTDFYVDYGTLGVLLPVAVYLCPNKLSKLVSMTVMLLLLGAYLQGVQWLAVVAIPLIALYNGERGKLRMKNFFYIYYPAHLAVIYLISLLVG